MRCLDCSSDVVAGSKRCLYHRIVAALRRSDLARLDTSQRREAYDQLDLCVQCGDAKDPNSKSYCRRCLDSNAAAARTRRQKG